MKRIVCLLLALLFLPLSAGAKEIATAYELDVAVLDNRTELDQVAMRDGSDATLYQPRMAKDFVFSCVIDAEQPLHQVYLRMNSLPDSAELQMQDANRRWQVVVSVANPGAEFVLKSTTALTGNVRIVVRYARNSQLNLTEMGLFGQGQLPADLHQWQAAGEVDVLFLADDLASADVTAVGQCCASGKATALAVLAKPEGDILTHTDALWEAGLRTFPLYGTFKHTEGDAKAKLNAWHETNVIKTFTSWLRTCQPLLAVAGGNVIRSTIATARTNASNYNYETDDAAAHGLWIVPEICDSADDLAARTAALAPRSYDALRAWCAEDFASAQHADPASIPYPENRLADGYLPEGEFVYEDADNGLWAYLSATVQVEIVRYEQPEFPRVWYQTDVKFKPEYEQFKQVVYANATFKDQQIYPETLAQTSNMVLAINADYYPYRLQRGQAAGNILRSGTVLYNYVNKNKRSFPNLDTLALLDDGSLEVYAGDEISADQLAARGNVHDALSFGPYLARDGKLRIYSGYSWETPEPRTAIGMVSPGHYRILTVEGRMPKGGAAGLNLNDLAKLMYSQGVTDAFNLDGGSTSVLIFMGKKLNLTGKGTSIGQPRNQHELYGVGTSSLTHTDMINAK